MSVRQPAVLALGLILIATVAGPAATALAAGGAAVRAYHLKGDYFEGCECRSVCACVWSEDATFDQCRGISAWRVTEGKYGATDLKGVTFAAAITKSGKSMDKSAGKWEGVVFLPQSATAAQREAVAAILKNEMGSVFAKMETRTVPVSIQGAAGSQEVTAGTTAHLRIAALKGANGKVPKIENPTSPLANPVNFLAKSTVNTYKDGNSSWDFTGRNAHFGPFEMKHD